MEKGEILSTFKEMVDKNAKAAAKFVVVGYREVERFKCLGVNENQGPHPINNGRERGGRSS